MQDIFHCGYSHCATVYLTIIKTIEGKHIVDFIYEALGSFSLLKNLALHCTPGPLSTDCSHSAKVILIWSFFSECSSQTELRSTAWVWRHLLWLPPLPTYTIPSRSGPSIHPWLHVTPLDIRLRVLFLTIKNTTVAQPSDCLGCFEQGRKKRKKNKKFSITSDLKETPNE